MTRIFDAIRANDLNAVRKWIRSSSGNAGIEGRGRTPLHLAAELGYADIAALLIENRADIHALDMDGKSPLLVAAEYGHIEAARVLMAAGATPSVRAKSSETALHLAVKCPSPSFHAHAMTELLAQEKYLLDYRLADGRTALMITAADDNAGMMEVLLKAGADPSLRDNEGRNAADWAKETGAHFSQQALLAWEAAREARHGLTRQVLVGHSLKLKIPKL